MAYECGNGGYISYGVAVTRLDITSWDATENSDWSETTNTQSAGYKEAISCKKWLSGTVNFDFDVALGPKGAPDIAAGDTAAVVLMTDGVENYAFDANILTVGWNVPAGSKITTSFTFESNGAYLYS